MTDLSHYGIDHVTDGIYISGARATWYGDMLREAGVTRVLKLYDAFYRPGRIKWAKRVQDDNIPVN